MVFQIQRPDDVAVMYRRLPSLLSRIPLSGTNRPAVEPGGAQELRIIRRLEIGDTAGWKPALRHAQAAYKVQAAIPRPRRAVPLRNWRHNPLCQTYLCFGAVRREASRTAVALHRSCPAVLSAIALAKEDLQSNSRTIRSQRLLWATPINDSSPSPVRPGGAGC